MSDAPRQVSPGIAAPSPVPGIPAEGSFVPRCPHCDYILIGLTVERCPECGRRFSLAQLRLMHMRRRPTPWEDPNYRGSRTRRYLKTWRAMLRPPFFLFLAVPADTAATRRATLFAVVSCLLTMVAWLAVMGRDLLDGLSYPLAGEVARLLPPTMSGAPFAWASYWPLRMSLPAALCLLVGTAAFVPIALVAWLLCWGVLARLMGVPEGEGRRRRFHQVAAFLSCWFLLTLTVLALGMLATFGLDAVLWRPLMIAPSFMVVVVAIAESALVTVWCCHADAALRDGLEYRGRLVGPLLAVLPIPVAMAVAGFLSYLVMQALAAAF